MGNDTLKEIYGLFVSESGVVVGRKGKVITGADNGRGYLIVTCNIDGIKTSKSIHRLVAEAWIPNPEGLPEVNHKDGNKRNNQVSNLEWTTRSKNIKHAFDNFLRTAVGERNARCTISEQTAIEICKLLAEGKSSAEIRDLGYNYQRVRSIKRRENWTHISKDFVW